MAKTVGDRLWEMLISAGVRRCYGIVGDALNPVIHAMRRNGGIDFVHVRHEEYGAFAAVAEARLTGRPVVVCGTAGPGAVHLINGLIDARRERVPLIVLAGDTDSSLLDSQTIEENNPYQFFQSSAVYIAHLVNPRQPVITIKLAVLVSSFGDAVGVHDDQVARLEASRTTILLSAMAAAYSPTATGAITSWRDCSNSAISGSLKPPNYRSSSTYRGEGPPGPVWRSVQVPPRPLKTPIMAEPEWRTKTTLLRASSRQMVRTSSAYAPSEP
jgi:pyruvate dehydrogenase (quinone)